VLGETAVRAVDVLDDVVADDPGPGLVKIESARVAEETGGRILFDEVSSRVRQLEVITGSEPEVGVLPLVLIDLDELLSAVAELEIVEGHVVAATRHVNRVVPDPLQGQVGDSDVVDVDVSELGGAGAVAGVEDDGVPLARSGSQGYVGVVEPQEGGDRIVTVGEEDGGVRGGGADNRRKIRGLRGRHVDDDVAIRRWSQRWTGGAGTPGLVGDGRE
jgi:hypothetical protein